MRIQVLVAAMNQTDSSLVKKMNIKTDAIIGNQCDRNLIEKFEFGNQSVIYLNFAERGVGLNRNNALMRADGDVCLFADDDMVYTDDYATIIENAYKEIPDAEVIIFNLIEKESVRYIIQKPTRVNKLNFLRYGAARISFRLSSVRANGIYFNQCFGGGTEYSHGEDNIFLSDCLKKGLKVYAYPAYIATLTDERPSTWESDNIEKYIKDQGVLYRQISRKWWRLLCLQDALRRHKSYGRSFFYTYRLMTERRKTRDDA